MKREPSGMRTGLDLVALLVELAPRIDLALRQSWSERKAALVVISDRVEEMIDVMEHSCSVVLKVTG